MSPVPMLATHLDGVGPGAASTASLRHPLPQVGVWLHREAEVGLLDVHAEQLVSQSETSIVSTDQSETSIVSASQSKTSIVSAS